MLRLIIEITTFCKDNCDEGSKTKILFQGSLEHFLDFIVHYLHQLSNSACFIHVYNVPTKVVETINQVLTHLLTNHCTSRGSQNRSMSSQ